MDRTAGPTLRDEVIDALGERSMAVADLRVLLGPPWVDRESGRDELDRLLQLDSTFTEVQGGVAHLPAVVEGTTWTVWVDADDGANGFVRMHPGLDALGWWLVATDVDLVDDTGQRRGALETDGRMIDGCDTDVVIGPDGWLDALVGHWARVDVVGGSLRWSRLDSPPVPTPGQVSALRLGFERAARDDSDPTILHDATPMPTGLRFASGHRPIHEALHADLRAFRDDPIPPLADLYAAADLVERRSIIAETDFDWDALEAWQRRNLLTVSYGLDPSQVDAASTLLAGFDTMASTAAGADPDSAPDPEVSGASALDDGDVAAAVWDQLVRRETSLDEFRGFAATIAPPESSSIGVVWLRARLLDHLGGEASAAVSALEAAVDGECRHRPALVDLAKFRADRGDAVGALRLLIQAGIEPRTDPHDDSGLDDAEALWDEVEGFATHRPRATARRNDPCPCGSGRKYKVCHLGRETHDLDDRAAWLYSKARRFARELDPDAVEAMAELVVDHVERPDLFDELVNAPFLADMVLHEDGMFADFLTARSELLPDDEALLAASWALVDRSVFEILDVGSASLELRDVARGEQITVVNTHPSRHTRPGMMLVGRPLPVGATYRAFGGFMNVPHGYLDPVLAAIDRGDSSDIADVLAAMLAPPRLTNTDGHELVTHTTTWRVPTPSAVGGALVAAGFRADSEGDWTLVRNSTNQNDTVIATVKLDGDELTVDVNSAARAAELHEMVAAALPDAEVVDLDIRPLSDFAANPPQGAMESTVDMDDPEIRALLAEHVAGFEQRWLDESIPALGGRTPRQAAQDPVGRENLTRLLASFPVPAADDVGAMDPRRLGAALGLD